MKERPIIFSGPMVRAILEGRKTMTRRVVKNAHIITCDDRTGATDTRCPYGVPGDRLWVKETFYVDHGDFFYGGPLPKERPIWADDMLYFRADSPRGSCCDLIPECQCAEVGPTKWRSSIHMPRWASRITLEVVGVLVQRVQDISEEDARAEGFASRAEFAAYWDTIHGPGAWERNDWVWVFEYRRFEEGER